MDRTVRSTAVGIRRRWKETRCSEKKMVFLEGFAFPTKCFFPPASTSSPDNQPPLSHGIPSRPPASSTTASVGPNPRISDFTFRSGPQPGEAKRNDSNPLHRRRDVPQDSSCMAPALFRPRHDLTSPAKHALQGPGTAPAGRAGLSRATGLAPSRILALHASDDPRRSPRSRSQARQARQAPGPLQPSDASLRRASLRASGPSVRSSLRCSVFWRGLAALGLA